jgi:hypothetical protein
MANDKIEFESGGVQVIVEARRGGQGDWGATFRIFGNSDDKKVETLRFDCFKKRPHFHYAPGANSENHDIDKTISPNPLGWVMNQLQTELSAMIQHAGFNDIARAVDQAAVAKELARLEPDIVQLHERALKELAAA